MVGVILSYRSTDSMLILGIQTTKIDIFSKSYLERRKYSVNQPKYDYEADLVGTFSTNNRALFYVYNIY